MEALLFISKFVGTTMLYLSVMTFGIWLFARIGDQPLSLRQALVSIAGTHIGRVRFLFLAGVISFVLMLIYPGSPLLVSEEFVKGLRKAWYFFLYGADAAKHYVPNQLEQTSWFWGHATLLYFGSFALYLLMALPNIVATSFQAGRSAWVKMAGGPTPRRSSLVWYVVWAFIAAFAAQLIISRRSAK